MIKFQTLSIIFVLMIVPITMLLSYYINSQIDTIAIQNSYDTKLLNSTYDAIIAFQLNTMNNSGYSTNAEPLRRDINASVKTFTTSLANNLGVAGYNSNAVLPYIPAVLYTLYDGYYIYAPMPNTKIEKDASGNDEIKTTYEHTLKPYVYYSARYYKSQDTDITVNYSLDNYVVIYGKINGTYHSKAGYLTYWDKYDGIVFENEAANYKSESEKFMVEFVNEYLNDIKEQDIVVEVTENKIKTAKELTDKNNPYYEFHEKTNKIFVINKNNDPEVKTSIFCEHKNSIIKKSIQSNLNLAINNYTKQSGGLGTTYDFKLPILSETEWDKILSNVSITTFMQGLQVGLKTYNNYMIVSSTGNSLYVDPEDLYFVTYGNDGKYKPYYHRINCPELAKELKNDINIGIDGYLNTDFDGVLTTVKDNSGNETRKYAYFGASRLDNNNTRINWGDSKFYELQTEISYNRGNVLACYECLVSSRVGGLIYDTDDKDKDSNGVDRGRTYAKDNKDNLITFVTETNTGKDYSQYYNNDVVTKLRAAYYNALFKERYKLVKVSSYVNKAS